jgi:hypothetical protein
MARVGCVLTRDIGRLLASDDVRYPPMPPTTASVSKPALSFLANTFMTHSFFWVGRSWINRALTSYNSQITHLSISINVLCCVAMGGCHAVMAWSAA